MRLTDKNKIKELATLQKNKVLMTDIDYKELKLGQLENIEDELGIELITLFKALKQQKVWTKYNNEIDLCDNCEYQLLESFIYFYWDNGKHLVFELKDYGKTWALTKEELEG